MSQLTEWRLAQKPERRQADRMAWLRWAQMLNAGASCPEALPRDPIND
jgi:hypothetical protein